MDDRDVHGEQQVWQRVFAQQPIRAREDLRGLLAEAMVLAAAYQQLAGTLSGKGRELAKHLLEGERANTACLRGLLQLSGDRSTPKTGTPVPREPASRLAETCYHRSRRCMAEYTARSADSEFGMVFQKMAQREAEHCAALAQLLGTLGK